MTKLLLTFASLLAVATLAHSQQAGVQFRGQAMQYSPETATLHCTKCVITLSPETRIHVASQGFGVDRATGAATFRGVIRLTFSDGEVVAEGGVLTTNANGVQRFSSDKLQFVSASKR